MSLVERRRRPPPPPPPLIAGQRLNQAEFHRRYEAMPPQTRAELVGGIVYMPSPLSSDQGESTPDVTTWLNLYRHRTPGLRLADNATVILGEYGEPQPDSLLRIEPERGGACFVNEDNYLTGPPELVAEVAKSSRPFDLGAKRADYERAGVQEYVVVTLDPNDVHWHVRRGPKLVRVRPGRDGLYRSKVFPGLWLDPAALLRGDLAGVLAALDRGLASPEHAAFVARLAAAAARAQRGQ
ncbi:MAG TPA: Uma2 family endonuclease [Isosphaeraceae bacterium]|nr:Uma2 family endonuclease [Isosphaeraceae bacterium]